jgi:hypothetical protein
LLVSFARKETTTSTDQEDGRAYRGLGALKRNSMLGQPGTDVRFPSDAAHSLITALAETAAPLQARKAYGGNGNIAPFIHNLHTKSR